MIIDKVDFTLWRSQPQSRTAATHRSVRFRACGVTIPAQLTSSVLFSILTAYTRDRFREKRKMSKISSIGQTKLGYLTILSQLYLAKEIPVEESIIVSHRALNLKPHLIQSLYLHRPRRLRRKTEREGRRRRIAPVDIAFTD